MVAFWYLLVLTPLIAIPVLWWYYRRKLARREELAGSRLQQLLKEARTGTETPVPKPALQKSAPLMPAPFVRRERVLDPVQTVVYYLLKNALPDHEVLSRVSLQQVLDLPQNAADDREQRLRGLAQHTVDFVVCNKALQPVAVIELLEQEPPAALVTAQDFRSRCLANSGVRHLRVLRTALPRREEVRGLVLGA